MTDPVAGSPPPEPVTRLAWRVAHALRTSLGIRRGFRAGDVYYKETRSVRLARALSRRGPGEKEFRVTFPDREKMLIHATAQRCYADVQGGVLLPVYRALDPIVRPGMRVLNPRSGTGYGIPELARMVGPSGAVVAIEDDEESALYAAKRYGAPNVAIEQGDVESLAWEGAGAFDGVVLITSEQPDDTLGAVCDEAWRVLAPGGFLALALGMPADDLLERAGRLIPAAFAEAGSRMATFGAPANGPLGIVIRRADPLDSDAHEHPDRSDP